MSYPTRDTVRLNATTLLSTSDLFTFFRRIYDRIWREDRPKHDPQQTKQSSVRVVSCRVVLFVVVINRRILRWIFFPTALGAGGVRRIQAGARRHLAG